MKENNWPLVGNEQITDYLKQCFFKNKVGGSYLFCGPEGLGKTTIAVFFAQLLFCRNATSEGLPCGDCPSCKKFEKMRVARRSEKENMAEGIGDLFILQKEADKKNISVEQVREFIHMLNLSSFGNAYKVGIIRQADALSAGAANALLKTLEEPRRNTLIILIADDKDLLPETIVSRSQVLQFRAVPTDTVYEYLLNRHNLQREKARDMARLCLGRPAMAAKFVEDVEYYDFYHDKVNIFLEIRSSDLNRRYNLIEGMLGKKMAPQELVKLSHGILRIWQGILRDFHLIVLGLPNLVQHSYVSDRLIGFRSSLELDELVEFSGLLEKSHSLLDANVNPKLVFEKLVLNVK